MNHGARRDQRRRRLGLAATALCVAVLSGGVAAAGDSVPWAEKAIRDHVNFEQFEGVLTADQLKTLVKDGDTLFSTNFTTADGLGRPMATQAIIPTLRKRPVDTMFRRTAGLDSTACKACHNTPLVGGGGDFTVNAFVSEGFESADFDTLDPQFSNERGTVALFGDGLVELLAREMTADLRAERQQAVAAARKSGQAQTISLSSKGVDFGKLTVMPDGLVDFSALDGVDSDLTIRPFSQKGVFTSIRQFTINAGNAHEGMEASERFGKRWTGTDDFDGDGVPDELSPGDISALVAFQATLPAPTRMVPGDPRWRVAAARGEQVFSAFGCDSCHRPSLPLNSLVFADPAPYDTAGTLRSGEVPKPISYDLGALDWVKKLPRNDQGQVLVPLFSDMKRHRISDAEVSTFGNELIAQRFVERDVFLTPRLWGVGSTAPYGHRADISTLDGVIRAHAGDATDSRKKYLAASDDDRSSLIAFLRTLVIQQ
jgi:cytochrome c peroxidase